ncbi:MAG: hypothetical protein HYU77_04975 [Betaproteobacteria bacterium]|nr:hypothetical protein [Betaproteobacteria bacterium]
MPLRIALWLALAGLIAGCGALKSREAGRDTPWLTPGQTLLVSEAEALLLYHEYLRRLSGAELTREHEGVKQAHARSGADFTRVQLAMLLSLPTPGFRDDGRAIGLLEPLLKEGAASSEMRALAHLLHAQIAEHRRLEERAREEQRRADGLQQKLEALKSIEKSLLEREPAKPRPR